MPIDLEDIVFNAILSRMEDGVALGDDAAWLRSFVRGLRAENTRVGGLLLQYEAFVWAEGALPEPPQWVQQGEARDEP